MPNTAGNRPVPLERSLRTARRCACLLLTLFLTACSLCHPAAPTPVLPVHFVHQDGFDVTWREQQDGNDVLFYGLLRNNTEIPLQNLTLTVYLLDQDGKIADSRTYVEFPMIYGAGASLPFSMRLPCPPGREGERALLELRYTLPNAIGPNYGVYQTICFLNGQK